MEQRGSRSGNGAGDRALRLFIAISLPEAVKEEIEKTQREMRRELPGDFMRWTKREQFHLTLKFLGNVAETRVGELSEALRGACSAFRTMRLRAERMGFFPNARFPRVAWVGVRDEQNELPRLQGTIETAAKDFTGEKGGEKFSGHVTLARIQGIPRPQAEILSRLAARMAEKSFGDWMGDEVELIRSELSSAGARYTTLASFPLARS